MHGSFFAMIVKIYVMNFQVGFPTEVKKETYIELAQSVVYATFATESDQPSSDL